MTTTKIYNQGSTGRMNIFNRVKNKEAKHLIVVNGI